MRVAYVSIEERGLAETLGFQPRADAELDWDYMLSQLPSEGAVLTRLHLEREGDVLRRAEFDGRDGPIVVSLIDDGSW